MVERHGWQPSVISPTWFRHKPFGIHGVGHVERVRVHALAIAEKLGVEDRLTRAVERACAWHDIGRTHDGGDPDHGDASARRVIELGLQQSEPPHVVDLALFAVRGHSRDDSLAAAAASLEVDSEAALQVLWILKDADGLDRVRIYDLDASRLRFEVSRKRERLAWEMFRRDQTSR